MTADIIDGKEFAAELRFRASSATSSSIRLSLAG